MQGKRIRRPVKNLRIIEKLRDPENAWPNMEVRKSMIKVGTTKPLLAGTPSPPHA